MYDYCNEAAFSKAVCAHLRKQNWFVQRIETGSTGRGVPDIYAISPDRQAMWLELKRVHINAKGRHQIVVPWRPGQQAWLHQVTKMGQTAMTLIACNDCIVMARHWHLYKNDILPLSQCQKIPSISAL